MLQDIASLIAVLLFTAAAALVVSGLAPAPIPV